MISAIRFAGYEWEHNPVSLRIEHRRNKSRCVLPRGCERMVDIGQGCNVVSGKGELIGSDCLLRYQELRRLFEKGRRGILSVPGSAPFYASFTALEMIGDTTPELITYSFEFTQIESRSETADRGEVYICRSGDTLYDIAYDKNISLKKLVLLNPDIRRPDELYEGCEVRLC